MSNEFFDKLEFLQKKALTYNLQRTHQKDIIKKMQTSLYNNIQKIISNKIKIEQILNKENEDLKDQLLLLNILSEHEIDQEISNDIFTFLTYLDKNPYFLYKIFKNTTSFTSKKTITNFLLLNYVENPFSNIPIKNEFLLIITDVLKNIIFESKSLEQVKTLFEKDVIIQDLILYLYTNYDVAEFLGKILYGTFFKLNSISEFPITFNKQTLKSIYDTKDFKQINQETKQHLNCLENVFKYKLLSDNKYASKFCLNNCIKEIDFQKREKIDYDEINKLSFPPHSGLSSTIISQFVSQLEESNTNNELNSLIDHLKNYQIQSKENNLMYSNINFNNSVNNLKSSKEIFNVRIKNACIIISIINDILDSIIQYINSMPKIISFICKLIEELLIIKFKDKGITDIEINEYITYFLFENVIYKMFDNPSLIYCLNQGYTQTNKLEILKLIKHILKRVLTTNLFLSTSEPEHTLFNYYILKTSTKVFDLFKLIKSNIEIPEFIKEMLGKVTDEEDCLKKLFKEITNENLKNNSNVGGMIFVLNLEELLFFIQKGIIVLDGLPNDIKNEHEYQKMQQTLLQIKDNSLQKMEQLFQTKTEAKINQHYLFYRSHISNEIKDLLNNTPFQDNETIENSNDNNKLEIKKFLYSLLLTQQNLSIDIFQKLKISNLNEFITNLDKILFYQSYGFMNYTETQIFITKLLNTYNKLTDEEKKEIELSWYDDLITNIQNKLSINPFISITELQRKLDLTNKKINETSIMSYLLEDQFTSNIARLFVELSNKFSFAISTQKAFLSSQNTITISDNLNKKNKNQRISNSIKEFCDIFIKLPFFDSKSKNNENYIETLAPTLIPQELSKTFNKITKTFEDINILEEYIEITGERLPPFEEEEIKFYSKIISAKICYYIQARITEVLFPIKTSDNDLKFLKYCSHFVLLNHTNCDLLLSEDETYLLDKALVIFHKIEKTSTPMEFINYLIIVLEMVKSCFKTKEYDEMKILFYFIVKSDIGNFQTWLKFIEMMSINEETRETQMFRYLNDISKAILSIDLNTVKEMNNEKEFNDLITKVLDLNKSA